MFNRAEDTLQSELKKEVGIQPRLLGYNTNRLFYKEFLCHTKLQ